MAAGIGRTLGLGFIFGAKDDGAIRMTEDIGEGMENMSRSVREVGEESTGVQRLGNFINALNLAQLTRVGSALEGLAERAGALSGEISSTSLESHGAQFAQEYRQATAGLGEYRAEVDTVRGQISSLSFDLGVGAEDMLAYATTVARTGRSIDDFGLSMRAVAGSIQANILSGEQLANVMTSLSEGYGLGAEGAVGIIDTITTLGTQFGVGTEAVSAMPDILEAVDQAAARFPSIGENVDVAIESITRLGLAQQRHLGGTFQDNLQGAITVFNELAATRREMQGLISGLSSEFPELAERIAQTTGDVGMSLEAIMQDPVRFASVMTDVFDGMDQNSVAADRLREGLERMSPRFMFLVQGTDDARAALQEATRDAGDTRDAFSNMASGAAGSTRTFAESMELVEERFRAGLDRMARRHYPNFERRVITRQRRAFDNLTGTINRYADERTGPFGAALRSMLALRRGGVMGLTIALEEELGQAFPGLSRQISRFLPMLDGIGEGLFEVVGQVGPFMMGMSAMGIRLPAIGRLLRFAFNPLTLIAGGIYLLVRYWDQLNPLLERGAEYFRQLGTRMLHWTTKIDWEKLGEDVVEGVLSVFRSLAGIGEETELSGMARNIADGFRDMFSAVTRIVGGMARGMWNRIIEWIMEPPDVESQVRRAGAAAGVTIGGVFGVAMLSPLRRTILRSLGRMFSGFGRILTGGRALGGGALRVMLRRLPYIGAIIGVLFDLPDIIASFRTEGIVSGFRELFRSIVNGLLLGIPGILEGWTGTDITGSIFDFLMNLLNIEEIVGYFRSGDILRGIIEAIYSIGPMGITRMLMERVIGEDVVNAYLDGITGLLETWGGVIRDTFNQWLGYVSPLWDEWMNVFREVGGVIGELWDDTLKPLLEEILGFSLDVEGVGGMFGTAEEGAQGFGNMIRGVMDWLMPKIQWLHRRAMPLVVAGIRAWADHIRMVARVIRFLWRIGARVFTYIVSAVELIVNNFRFWGSVISWLWTNVTRPTFRLIYRLFRRIFLGLILPIGVRVFRTIGAVIETVWTRVIRPVFEFWWNLWSTIMSSIWNTARRTFNIIRDYISEKIEQAAYAFRILAATWNETKTVLASGFRLIAAELNRYIIVPFLRVRNTMGALAETMHTAFLRVKLAIVGLFATMLENIQSIFSALGTIGRPLARAMEGPLESVRGTMSDINRDISDVQRRGRTARQENERRIEQANARSEEARREFQEAEAARQQAVQRAAMEEAQRRAARRTARRAEREAVAPTREPRRVPGRAPTPTREPRHLTRQEMNRFAMNLMQESERGLRREERRQLAAILTEMESRGMTLTEEQVARAASLLEGTRGAERREALLAIGTGLGEMVMRRAAEEGEGRPVLAEPSVPTPEEDERRARRTATRREGAVAGEQRREAEELAREIMIQGFSGQAKRDMTEAMRAAMPRPITRRREAMIPTPPGNGNQYQR